MKTTFCCLRCVRTGNRSECYAPQPGRVPGFVDVCPACKSTDIDIIAIPQPLEKQPS